MKNKTSSNFLQDTFPLQVFKPLNYLKKIDNLNYNGTSPLEMPQVVILQFLLSNSTLPSQSFARCWNWSLSVSVHVDHSQSSAGEQYSTKCPNK